MKNDELADFDDPVKTARDSAADAALARAPRIMTINTILVAFAGVLAIVAIIMVVNVLRANMHSMEAHKRYNDCVAAVTDLKEASDYLTTESRMYTVTGEVSHLYGYLNEYNETRRRDKAVETLRLESGDQEAIDRLAEALQESNLLAEHEFYAMRLTADATGVSPLPFELSSVELAPEDDALPTDQKREYAGRMLTNNDYSTLKALIMGDVEGCANELISVLKQDEAADEQAVESLLTALLIIVLAFVASISIAAIANYVLVMRPMRIHAHNIHENEQLELIGSREMLYVVTAYNQIYDENHRRTLLLKREAETDALTGLLNRGSFNKLLKHHVEDVALVLIDVDMFKHVNDTYGHDVGDAVLIKVANSIRHEFRTSDYACRIGGDEFAVIMTETGSDKRDVIVTKLKGISAAVADTSGGLPAVTTSAGVAFSSLLNDDEHDIYQAADEALYKVKRAGRDGYGFFGLDDAQ